MGATRRILVLHGPNLNLLGRREPEVYGSETLADIETDLRSLAKSVEREDETIRLEFFQSNHEGALVDRLHEAMDGADGVLFNPGAYGHTSIALRDAIAGIGKPVIEVHLSHTPGREEFRRTSMIAPVCVGLITGFGTASYRLGLRGLLERLRRG